MIILRHCLIEGINSSLLKLKESEYVPLLIEALVPIRPLLAATPIISVILRRVWPNRLASSHHLIEYPRLIISDIPLRFFDDIVSMLFFNSRHLKNSLIQSLHIPFLHRLWVLLKIYHLDPLISQFLSLKNKLPNRLFFVIRKGELYLIGVGVVQPCGGVYHCELVLRWGDLGLEG